MTLPPPTTPGHHAYPSRRMSRHRTATVLISALLALLGFALAVQFHSNSQTDSLASDREDDLVRILDDQNSRLDRLQRQISDLQAVKQQLSDSGSNDAAARAAAQHQADVLAVLAGTQPAHGPGVRVTISDARGQLKAEDLLDVIEELRGAGAEVIQFGQVRVVTSSAFSDSNSGVVLDGATLRAPYVVLAIGEPQTLETALNIVGGVASTVRNAGGDMRIDQQQTVGITAVRDLTTPQYAKPTGK